MRSFCLDKSTHFFRLLQARVQSSPKNGIIWRAIPFSRIETLLQLKATQVVGILLHLLQATSLKTSTKSEMNLPDPGSSGSVTRENIAIFQLCQDTYKFEVSGKNRNSCGILLRKKWRFC